MDKARSASPMTETELESIPVKLRIELGELDSTLGELSALAPGAVLPLSRPLQETVQLMANGRRIGYGTLVRMGDSVAVRVTRLIDTK